MWQGAELCTSACIKGRPLQAAGALPQRAHKTIPPKWAAAACMPARAAPAPASVTIPHTERLSSPAALRSQTHSRAPAHAARARTWASTPNRMHAWSGSRRVRSATENASCAARPKSAVERMRCHRMYMLVSWTSQPMCVGPPTIQRSKQHGELAACQASSPACKPSIITSSHSGSHNQQSGKKAFALQPQLVIVLQVHSVNE